MESNIIQNKIDIPAIPEKTLKRTHESCDLKGMLKEKEKTASVGVKTLSGKNQTKEKL